MSEFRKGSNPALFIELSKPDNDGFSREVNIEEFVGKYQALKLGNGGSWCRDDATLGKKYNIHRKKEGIKIVSISLHGYKKVPIEKSIKAGIRKEIGSRKCVVLNVGNVEIDHKDGARDNPELSTEQQKVEDFQPLSKSANNAKRQHCKKCRETLERFDATLLGYSVGRVKGNGIYRGSCVGCYWYDPLEFNKQISQNFKK